MNCARREAGAHRPAASTLSRPPSSRQAPSRGRARLSLLLPVAALLLGALGLFAAAPAQAQSTVWSATLTVDVSSSNYYFGCRNRLTTNVRNRVDSCASTTALTDDDFTYEGVTYTVTQLLVYSGLGTDRLNIKFDGLDARPAKSALKALTLKVDGRKFRIGDAGTGGDTFLDWSGPPRWTNGQKVRVTLTKETNPRIPLTGLRATAGDGEAVLTWDNPNASASRTGRPKVTFVWEYRQRAGSGAWGAWTAIPGSRCRFGTCRPFQGPAEMFVVRGLENGTTYSFEVRSQRHRISYLSSEGGNTHYHMAPAPVTARPSGSMAPVGVTPGPGADALTVAWTPPDAQRGGYDGVSVQWKSGAQDYDGSRRVRRSYEVARTVIGGLVPGRQYTVRVLRLSDGRSLGEATATTTLPAPAKPTGFLAKAGDARVTLSWADAGDPSIAKHQYRRKAAGGEAWSAWTDIPDSAPGGANAASYTVTRLRNGVSYAFDLRAVNATGAGPASEAALVAPAVPVAPAKPAGFSAAEGNTRATLSWADAGDSSIAKHQIRYKAGRAAWNGWTDIPNSAPGGANAASYTMNGLKNMMTYAFQVRAVNAVGAGPASAEARATPVPPTTVWSATLEVDRSRMGGVLGCSNSQLFHANCADRLSDNDFVYRGVAYTVAAARWLESDKVFQLSFASLNRSSIPARLAGLPAWAAKKAFGGLTLHVGNGRRLAIGRAGISSSGQYLTWPLEHNPGWHEGGRRVSLSLATPTRPAKPAHFAVAAEDARATLFWVEASSVRAADRFDFTVTGHQYRQKAGGGAWGAWTDIPDSGSGEANADSYTLTGLMNGVTYAFELRAVNAAGAGPASSEATAATPAPQTAIWSATLTTYGIDGDHGCAIRHYGGPRYDCSRADVLTDDGFTYNGVVYKILSLQRVGSRGPGGDGAMQIGFASFSGARISGTAAKAALGALTLTVDGRKLPFSLASTTGDLSWGYIPLPRWTDGQAISVSLIGPAPTPAGPPPPLWSDWSPTLTAGLSYGVAGCWNRDGTGSCSSPTVLTANEFRHKGATYRIAQLLRDQSGKLILNFDGQTGAEAKTALSGLTLHVDGYRHSFDSATVRSDDALLWPFPPAWTDGQTVSLSLGRTTTPDKPTGFAAETFSNNTARLSWTEPRDSSITKRQFRQKEASRAWSAWTDIPNSASGEANAASYTVTGLKAETSYAFKLRAVNAVGVGPESDEVKTATPTTVWSATLTVDVSASNYFLGCRNFRSTNVRNHIHSCADTTALTDDDFTYEGVTYTVNALNSYVGLGADSLILGFVGLRFLAAKTALNALTLNVDGRKFHIRGAGDGDLYLDWRGTPRWTDGQKVKVSLTTDGRITRTAPPVAGPALEWARVNAAELALRFDKALDESSAPAGSAFSVSVAGAARDVTAVSVRQDLVTLTLASAVSAGETVTVGYTPPSSGGLRLPGGGAAVAAFSGQAVTNDTPSGQPQVQGPPEPVEPPAAEALTARIASAPSEHRGKGRFVVRVAFSAPVAGRAKDAAIEVSGGTLARAARVDERKDLWALRIAPSGYEAVTVTLPATADCAAAGAVCTADGRRLETALTHTIQGPPALSVADASAHEGPGATLDFAVTLSRAASGEVTVNYATRDGTAKKGKDYRLAKGTLSFAAGETSKTVSVALLDDAHDEGAETFRLVLKKATGAAIADGEAVGTIENADPLQKDWLARFGRAAAADAVAAVTARLETPRDAGSHVTLSGQRVDLSDTDGGRALEQALTGFAQLLGGSCGSGPEPDPDGWPDRGAARDGAGAVACPAPRLTGRALLLGTSFRAVLGGGAGSQWTSWGQGASVSAFSSATPSLSLSGETATGSLGMDYEHGRLLTGFAMTHSLGEGTAQGAGRSYLMGSSVTTALPYVRYALSERLSAWGLAGTGSGRLTLDLDGEAPERYGADLSMTLAAVGARGDLVTPAEAGGFALALKADAFWVRTESESVSTPEAGNLAGARADASRVRAVLDGSRTFALAGGGTMTPSVALGVRHDGGDAETGTGFELGAGLGYADPARGLDMALRVHGLAAHAEDGYDEWGVSGSLRLVPGAAGRGLSASLTPSWGADPGGSERLWMLPDAHAMAPDGDAPLSRRLDAEVGYGIAMFGGGFTGTPNVGMGLSDTARELRLGWRLAPAGGGGFEVNLDAARREAANDDAPEHRVGLGLTARW